MSNIVSRLFCTAALAASMGAAATPALAATAWQQAHPRRAEVNGRLAHQHARIRHEVAEGELSRPQAGQLLREDHAIRSQERRMASEHGGHITAREQRVLNREENAVSQQIPR